MLHRSNAQSDHHMAGGPEKRPARPWRWMTAALAFATVMSLTVLFFTGQRTTRAASSSSFSLQRPVVGFNFNSPDADDRPFADAMKTSRATWHIIGNFNTDASADSNGWPTTDAGIIVWEGSNNNDGTYQLIFNGQATLSDGGGYGTYTNQSYDQASNTTTATIRINDTGYEVFDLSFTSTKRTASSATNTGVTNVRLMRPTSEGATTSFDSSVTFTPWIKTALSTFAYLRFMAGTNWNTSVNWSDRTRPYQNSQKQVLAGESGSEGNMMAYEYMVQLCNETNNDLYVNVPDRANDDYVTKLAQLVQYGSDGVNPYTSPQSNPVFAPLNSNRHVYIEYTNEAWNYGFQQTHDMDDYAAAEIASNANSPLKYDGQTDRSLDGRRYYARRAIQVSDLFRGVVGDSAMMTRVRPLLFWQYDDLNGSAEIEMDFLNDYYNNADGIQHVSTPHPVSYYIWGGGGAAYYDSGNDSASTVDGIFASGLPRFGGLDTYQSVLNTEAAWTHAYGLHTVSYEGGWAVGHDNETSLQHQAKLDPRAKQTQIDAFNDFAASGGEMYTVGTYSQWDNIYQATTYPLMQALATVNSSSFTPASATVGNAVSSSGTTTIPVSNDFTTSNSGLGGTINSDRSEGYVIRPDSAGTYQISVSVANANAGGQVNVYVDGYLLSTISVPNTGSDTTYQTVSAGSIALSAGTHGILLHANAAASGTENLAANVSAIVVQPGSGGGPTPTPTTGSTPTPTPTTGSTPTPTPTTGSTPTPTPTPISGGSLPSPWQNQDIGSVGSAGSASYSSGTFTVAGSGNDIWGTADAFQYVYQPLSGDGTIIARVASVQNTNSWAKAGVMIRESLNANSTYADTIITPGNGSALQDRTSTGGSAVHTVGSNVSAPYWVKLVRSGNTFTSSISSDGSSWTQVGTATISMASSVYIGLAVTAHNNGALNTSSFDNVSVSSGTTATWTKCADEGGTCTFSGTHQVRYGANGQYNYQTATGSIGCNNNVFGDPIVGTVKECDYQ